MPESPMRRVTREKPCPICGKPDWCLASQDGTACICARIESPKRVGEAGWLHKLSDTPAITRPRHTVIRLQPDGPDLTDLAAEYRGAVTTEALGRLASHLGVSVESLKAFGVGWSRQHSCWSFPMTDPATGRICGIRLRRPNGFKFSVKGGRNGLFMPAELPESPPLWLILEGASDALAAFTLGFSASIGRPSCTGGTAHIRHLVRHHKPAQVAIVADNDTPGTRGATALARELALLCRDVRTICTPAPHKDLRSWLQAGGTAAELAQLIESAPSLKLTVRIR